MDAKKMLREKMRSLERSEKNRSKGNVGGIKLLPTLVHGDQASVRNNNIPVRNFIGENGKIDFDAMEDYD